MCQEVSRGFQDTFLISPALCRHNIWNTFPNLHLTLSWKIKLLAPSPLFVWKSRNSAFMWKWRNWEPVSKMTFAGFISPWVHHLKVSKAAEVSKESDFSLCIQEAKLHSDSSSIVSIFSLLWRHCLQLLTPIDISSNTVKKVKDNFLLTVANKTIWEKA